MLQDRYGLAISTTSGAARDAYVDGVDRLLASDVAPGEAFMVALAADPDFALAHSAMARVHQGAGRGSQALESVEQALALADEVTARERSQIMIQRHLVKGELDQALEATKVHLDSYPLDAMVLAPSGSVFGLIGFGGRQNREPEQLDLLTPLVDAYGDDWWFLAVHAFALVETGDARRGQRLVEQSLERNPRSAHAAHIYAHALYEQGADTAATDFLADWLPDYDPRGALHCHLWWHYALLLIGAGQADEAWSLFDQHCAPGVSQSPALNVLTDGTSLAWRSMLAGKPVDSNRWSELEAYYQQKFGKPMTFLAAHAGLPLVGQDNDQAVADYVAQVSALAEEGKLVAGDVAVAMTTAFHAYHQQRWDDVIDALAPMLGDVVRIGGSRAQRDLAFNTVLSAYVRAERLDEAHQLLASVDDRSPSRPIAGL